MRVVHLQQTAVDDALHEGVDHGGRGGPHGVAQSVLVGVDEADEGFEEFGVVGRAVGHHDRQQRKERLVPDDVEAAGRDQAVHPHHGGLQEHPGLRLGAVQLGAVAAGHQLGALVEGALEQREEALAAPHRGQQDFLVLRISGAHLRGTLGDLGDEPVGDRGVRQDVVGDHADLPGAVERLGDRLGRLRNVGVLPNHDAVVAGQFEDGLLPGRHAPLLETQALLAAADVEDVVDQRVRQPAVDGLTGVGADGVEYAGRRADLVEERPDHVTHQPHGAQRDAARGAHDDAVAGHQGQDGQGGAGSGRVLRRVEGHHTVGLPADDEPSVAVRELGVHLAAVPLQALLAEDLEQTAQLPAREPYGMRLGHKHRDELVLAADQFLSEEGSQAHPPLQRHGSPAGRRRGCRLGGQVDRAVARDGATARDVGMTGGVGIGIALEFPLQTDTGEHVLEQGPGADRIHPAVTVDVLAGYVELVAVHWLFTHQHAFPVLPARGAGLLLGPCVAAHHLRSESILSARPDPPLTSP